jgi:flagellar protein FliJ
VKRFIFRLQVPLNHRRDVEQVLLGELAALQREKQLEMQRLGDLRLAREASWEALASLAVNGASPWDLANGDEHCKALGDDIGLQELNSAAAQKKVEEKLLEVIEAAKERKVLEQLCEKQRSEYELAAARQEQNELDEMASMRFARGAA